MHALEYWDHVVDAADSIVFRLMFNSLRAAYEPALEALAPLMAEEVGQIGAYRLLTAAIGAGRPRDRPRRRRPGAPAGDRQPARRPDRPWRRPVTKATPEVEELAAQRLAADEQRITGRRSRPPHERLARRRLARVLRGARRPWMIGAFLLGVGRRPGRRRRRRLVGAARSRSAWSRCSRSSSGSIHVGDPALAPAPRRPGRRRLAAGPQAPRAPRRPARPPAGLHPVAGRWPGCSRRTSWSPGSRCRPPPAR